MPRIAAPVPSTVASRIGQKTAQLHVPSQAIVPAKARIGRWTETKHNKKMRKM